jgi:hypothetical protein
MKFGSKRIHCYFREICRYLKQLTLCQHCVAVDCMIEIVASLGLKYSEDCRLLISSPALLDFSCACNRKYTLKCTLHFDISKIYKYIYLKCIHSIKELAIGWLVRN